MYLLCLISCRGNSKEDYANDGGERAQDFSHQESSTGIKFTAGY